MGFFSTLKPVTAHKKANDESVSHSGAFPQDSACVVDGETYFDCREVQLHEHAHPLGGLACHDHKLREEQQAAITEWVTSLGKRLLTGNGLGSLPAPVKIFEPRSNLQKVTDAWVYTEFLDAAAAAPEPLARFKFVIAWFIAGLQHIFDTWRKPFNPILGETWQGENSHGCKVYLEQISHHPPVASFKLTGRGWEVTGLTESSVAIVVKHRGFKQIMKGARTLRFADGDAIEFSELPAFVTKGVTSSTDLRADVSGQAVLHYTSAALGAYISFGPLAGADDALLSRTDTFTGYVAPLSGGDASHPLESSHALSEMPSLDMKSTHRSSESVPRNAPNPPQPPTGLSQALRPGELRAPESSYRIRAVQEAHNGAGSAAASESGLTPAASVRNGAGGSSASNSGIFKFASTVGVTSWLRSAGAADVDVAPSNALATLRGSWLSHMDFNAVGASAECVWRVQATSQERFASVPAAMRLPTDATFRADMQLLARGDVEGAQAEKDRLEERQRRERKLRPKSAR